ncbi:hypothetical protein J2S03_000223 [Alicyclobacillus cycloheptanicus]|jgi:hypothetical protein|uniref:Uncharacterized protein n=1 Tax=Alicyclobacillus cycloheptanicus TaxID=1457 RepID=A0ABT9XEB6_9BACL|nr:hypothetical protein [Alicyclobacillus cycloheptanicus]
MVTTDISVAIMVAVVIVAMGAVWIAGGVVGKRK